MDDDTKIVSRLSGGVIGVVLLALVGGGVGTFAYSTLSEGNSPAIELPEIPGADSSKPDDTIVIAEGTSGIDPNPQAPTEETVDGPIRKPAGTETIIDPKPAIPMPEPTPEPRRPQRPEGIVLKQATFIVRFNKDDDIQRCLKLYRADKAASRAEFAKWAKNHPELAGLSLERVNYSGEAILAYDSADDAKPASSAKQLQARLQSLDAVRYADPDYTAHPGKGG